MTIVSREAAKALGQKYYFTGKPCRRRGHIEKRWVSSFMCVACGREKQRERHRRITGCRPRKIGQDPNYFKQYYAAHKGRRKAESKEWYRENAEYAQERQKAYVAKRMAEAPELLRAQKRKASNTRRAITHRVFVEVIDPHVVFERDKGVCGICLKPVEPSSPWEIDHIMPISKGGVHAYANVQLSHRTCNRRKWARTPVPVEAIDDG